MSKKLRLGVILNPVAGIGGAVALKGSDGIDIQKKASDLGGKSPAQKCLQRFLTALAQAQAEICFVTCAGAMGESVMRTRVDSLAVLGDAKKKTRAADTQAAATAMIGVDLLVFVGGDGTARDLLDVLPSDQQVLGIPAGVKMHSGVFAITPEAAATIVHQLLTGGLVAGVLGEVRDIDEAALRSGSINSRFYGEMKVPKAADYLQHTKVGGRENEALGLLEIVQDTLERIEAFGADHPDHTFILGAGSTLFAVKQALGMDGELLGVDAYRGGQQIGKDLTADELLKLKLEHAILVISFSRNQGFLFGRGNQQISSEVLRRLPREHIWLLGTRTKLATLEGRPLLLDTGSRELDHKLSGLIEITAGYADRLLYRVGLLSPQNFRE